MQYLENTLKLGNYYKKLGELAIAQVKPEEIHWTPGPSSNSLAVIVKHLWGNMLSRWTNFITEDGEKPWRDREAEFDSDVENLAELHSKWNEGWNCFLSAIRQLKEEDLSRIIFIRNEGCTVMDALQRQMAHYPMHIGQIIYLVKILRGEEWKSLSIPKGESANYNEQKFSKPKELGHFTDQV